MDPLSILDERIFFALQCAIISAGSVCKLYRKMQVLLLGCAIVVLSFGVFVDALRMRASLLTLDQGARL